MDMVSAFLPAVFGGLLWMAAHFLLFRRGPRPWRISDDIVYSRKLSDEDAVRWLLRYYRTLDYPNRGSLLRMFEPDAVEYLTYHRPRTIPGVPRWDHEREAAAMRRRIRRARRIDLLRTVLTLGADTRAARRRWLRSPDQAAAWHEVETCLDAPEPPPNPAWLTDVFKAAVAARRERERR